MAQALHRIAQVGQIKPGIGKTSSMLQLDNARFSLVAAMPTPSQWHGPAAQAHELQVWELIHELNAVVDSLWV